jgi:hypothetical protein
MGGEWRFVSRNADCSASALDGSAAARHSSPQSSGLAWLLSPTPVDHFFKAYWERRQLLIGRAAPDYFAALPGIDAWMS